MRWAWSFALSVLALMPAAAAAQAWDSVAYGRELVTLADGGEPCMEWWVVLRAQDPKERIALLRRIVGRGAVANNPYYGGAAYELASSHALGIAALSLSADSVTHWLDVAAGTGNPDAQYWLATRLLDPADGAIPDYRQGRRWITEAAHQGHARAQALIAIHEVHGAKGFRQDNVSAYRWLLLARATEELTGGTARGVDELIAAMEEKMDAGELQAGQDSARAFVVRPSPEVGGLQPILYDYGTPMFEECARRRNALKRKHGYRFRE